jgi:hypothetical protein
MSASMNELMQQLAEQSVTKREASIVGQVGLHFRQTVNVRIRKPRWMPEWAYRRLMRTIVVEETWPTFTSNPLDNS